MLTFTQFSGSPYHIGLALGKAGAPAMHDLIKPSPLWENLMQWLGSDELLAMQELVQQHHPYIWDELQGLARGLELPPDDVFLWNSQGALPAHPADDTTQQDTKQHNSSQQHSFQQHTLQHDNNGEIPVTATRPVGVTAVESTTILMPTPQGPRIVHHMAGDPDVADHCGVAEFIVDQGPEFAAFISPGLLPGHALAVTNSGLCMTVNTTQPQDPGIGIPGVVLTRALLNMPDLSSAIQFLNDSPRCGGMHLSLAQRGGSALLGIETTAEQVSIQHAKDPTLHTNHLIHEPMHDVAQTTSPSSLRRLEDGVARLDQIDVSDPLHPLANVFDPLRLLAELTSDARTLVTADLHINAETVDWDVYEDSDESARFRMRDAKHI